MWFTYRQRIGFPQSLIIGTSEKITVLSDGTSVFDHRKPKNSPTKNLAFSLPFTMPTEDWFIKDLQIHSLKSTDR
jgi:hypothetical protein